VQIYRFLVADDLRRGALVEALAPYAGRTRPFSILRAAGRPPTLAVRTVLEAIAGPRSADRKT
jgi:hypothetical protein